MAIADCCGCVYNFFLEFWMDAINEKCVYHLSKNQSLWRDYFFFQWKHMHQILVSISLFLSFPFLALSANVSSFVLIHCSFIHVWIKTARTKFKSHFFFLITPICITFFTKTTHTHTHKSRNVKKFADKTDT